MRGSVVRYDTLRARVAWAQPTPNVGLSREREEHERARRLADLELYRIGRDLLALLLGA